jgi:hypothetical protein
MGFVDAKFLSNDKVEVSFKVRNNDKPKSKGFICNQTSFFKTQDVEDAIRAINPEIETELKGKINLCKLFELAIRMYKSDEFARVYDGQRSIAAK